MCFVKTQILMWFVKTQTTGNTEFAATIVVHKTINKYFFMFLLIRMLIYR